MVTNRTTLIVPAALCLVVALCATTQPVRAQDARLQLPAFEGLARKAAESVDITLDAALLQLAAGFLGAGEDEAAIKQVLRDLKGIYVKSFEFAKDGEYSVADVESVRTQLARGNWTRLVDVKSTRDGNSAEVYVWMDQSAPGGLAIVSTEPRQLTIVNIVGRIDLEKLRKLEGQLGIPRMELEGERAPKE